MKKLLFTLCCFLLLPVDGVTQSFDINDWFTPSNYRWLNLSPDGEQLLWRESSGARDALRVQNIKNSSFNNFTLDDGEKVKDAFYIDDAQVILNTFIGELERVYLIDVNRKTSKLLIEQMNPVSVFSHGVSKHGVWLFENDALFWFDFKLGQKSQKVKLPLEANNVLFAKDAIPCLAITRDGDSYQFINQQWTKLELPKNIHQINNNLTCTKFQLLAKQHSDTQSLFEFENNQIKKIFSVDGFDLNGFYYSEKSDAAAGIYYDSAYPQYQFFSATFSRLDGVMNQLASQSYWKVLASNRDETHWVVQYQSPTMPPQIIWVDSSNGKIVRLSKSLSGYSQKKWAKTQVIKTRIGNKQEVISYLTQPAVINASTPLIIRLHGGPFRVRDQWRFDAEAQWLAEQGYAFLTINYRGSWGFGESFQKQAYGKLIEVIEDDVESVLDDVMQTYNIDKNKMCLYGASFGAYAALSELIENNDYLCAVMVSPVSDLTGIYKQLNADDDKKLFTQLFGKTDNKDWQNNNNLLEKLEDLEANILIAYGVKDKRVSPKQSQLLSSKLEQLKKPHKVIELSNSGHQIEDAADRKHLYRQMALFLKENLKVKTEN